MNTTGLHKHLAIFRCALAFYTRLPVGSAPLPPTLDGTCFWLPAIGIITGLLAALVMALCSLLFPWQVCGLAGCFAWTFVTGGLHLDGLADCADGLLLEASPEKRLAVMKDSRLGTFGGAALFFALAAKFTALAVLAERCALSGLSSFLPLTGMCCLAGCLARSAVLPAMFLPSARPGGLGEAVKAGLTRKKLAWSLLPALLLCLVNGFCGLLALLLAAAVSCLFLRAAKKRLGGVTGDVFGCLIELVECTVLIGCCAL